MAKRAPMVIFIFILLYEYICAWLDGTSRSPPSHAAPGPLISPLAKLATGDSVIEFVRNKNRIQNCKTVQNNFRQRIRYNWARLGFILFDFKYVLKRS